MSAGTGVFHSEKNDGEEILRLLQIWILPDRSGYTPQYGEACIPWEDRENRLLHIVSGHKNTAYVKIHQDMDIYVSAFVNDVMTAAVNVGSTKGSAIGGVDSHDAR